MKRTLLVIGFIVISSFYFVSDTLAADGWAGENGGTTGGEGGTTVTVTTAADFKTYVESPLPYIVQVSGTIDLGGGVSITSNKTIEGTRPSSTIIGRLGFADGSSNIIIQGLNITNPSYVEADGISVKYAINNLFITKCTIYDCGDGCIDITNESDYVTVSWCKFYYTNFSNSHRFVNLFSSSDTSTGDRGKLRITFHHNWWSTLCDERMPRGRFGQVHIYNNYYSCSGNGYCIGVGVESQLRVESNYFDGINNAWKSYNTDGYTPGIIGWNSDNRFVNGTTVPTWATNDYATVFTPPYSYTLDDGVDVKSLVMAYAGNTRGLTIKKCTVKAGKTQASDANLGQDAADINNIKDSFTASGTAVLPTNREDINFIDVYIVSGDGNTIYSETIDFNYYNNVLMKRGKYSYSHKITKAEPAGAITSLKIDFSKNPQTFALTAANINLTGLACPFELDFVMDGNLFSGDADEAIVNGKSKLIPSRFMRMYDDTLVVSSASAKHNATKAYSDSMSAKGFLAVEDIGVDLCSEDVNFIWGEQVFNIPHGRFTASKTGHLYKCRKVAADANYGSAGMVTASIDIDKSIFTISLKAADSLDVTSDYIKFGVNFGDFNETADVNRVTKRSY
jgi:pectate lyase